ncbi:MAG: homocysteine S-methyltransferase family protein [Candidatus Aminicenantes bacterium]|nr:homocysteine S-methyltransferase family protein [Candidatus Aminicenantes bacterium]
MSEPTILDRIARRSVLLDGAIGTELMKRGLVPGTCPELMNVEHPAVVQSIHRDYYAAGCDAVTTNSFGASPLKLSAYGLAGRAYELNLAAARNAVSVRPEGRFVGGGLGPTGKFLKPQGEHTESELEAQFAVQVRGLVDGGADFLLVETMFDLREALAAVRGIRRESSLPVFASLTFNKTPRGFFTLMGDSLKNCVEALEAEDIPVLGANCTLASGEMADLAAVLRTLTSRPFLIQANAGRPEIRPDGKVVYLQTVDEYLADVPRIIAQGAAVIGGCCGTNPEHLRRMASLLGLS